MDRSSPLTPTDLSENSIWASLSVRHCITLLGVLVVFGVFGFSAWKLNELDEDIGRTQSEEDKKQLERDNRALLAEKGQLENARAELAGQIEPLKKLQRGAD